MTRNSLQQSPVGQQWTPFPYLLSVVSQELKQRVVLNDRIKNSIEYKNVFDGQQAVVRTNAFPLLSTLTSRLTLFFLSFFKGQVDDYSGHQGSMDCPESGSCSRPSRVLS
jgi:hypothetical protein